MAVFDGLVVGENDPVPDNVGVLLGDAPELDVSDGDIVAVIVVLVVPVALRVAVKEGVDETVGVADVDRVAVEFGVLDCVDVPVAVALVVGVTD